MNSLSDEMSEETAYRHGDPATDEALEWFIRIDAGGDIDAEERQAFEAWLDRSGENRAAYDHVRGLRTCPELTVATANLYPPVETTGKRPFRSRRPIAGWLMAAASAASILAAASFTGILADLGADWGADYRTAAGETSNIVLPDGSRVHLNSDTALSLDFDGGRRGVSLLKGEAWFEVAHDQKRAFTVAGGYSIVHVTGTSFDVSREDEADRVHLVTGRIYLTPRENDATSLHLTPGETAKADRGSISRVATADDDRLLAWRSGWIVLSGTPLREALAEIERYTDSRLLTLAPSILETPVSGSFRIENADDAIASVVTAAGGKIDHLPGGFIIIR